MFSKMWIDVEDPKASGDQAANAAFIQGGVDQCARRIFSGIYGNEGSLQRIIGDDQRFAGFPYWRASGDGVPDVNDVPVNGMHVEVEQFSLDRSWNGHAVDIDVRKSPAGFIEYGVDLSNFSEVPDSHWFESLWSDPNYPVRFIVFGDQMPYVARAQLANAQATSRPFDYQLYTYINMPGGDYYAGRDAAQQVDDALDQMGVPEAAPADQPAPVSNVPLIAVRAKLDTVVASANEALRLLQV